MAPQSNSGRPTLQLAPGSDDKTSLLGAGRQFLTKRVEELGLVLTGFFAIVVAVAGASALALLAWPSQSGAFFSWDLGDQTAAAFVGGLYLASVIVFADAAMRPREESRTLIFGVLGLALPTLVFTGINHDVFDWSRPQAGAWVILFCSAPVSILLDLRKPTRRDTSPKLSSHSRFVLAAVSLVGASLAVGLWFDSSRSWLAGTSPVALAGLTADYLGAWAAFVGISATVAFGRGRSSDGRTIGVLLGSISLGAALALIRTKSSLQADPAEYIAALAALSVLAFALIRPHHSRPRCSVKELMTSKHRTTARQSGDNEHRSTLSSTRTSSTRTSSTQEGNQR